ncbi:MAG: glycerate kinase type-2 family protein [Nitrososphaerota archaeon]
MIIKNYKGLALNYKKTVMLQILEAGLAAAMPYVALKKTIQKNRLVIGKNTICLSKYERIFVIGLGKAADSMASAINSLTDLDGGIIVIPQDTCSILKNKKFKILHGGHPLPNKQSIHAAKTIIKFLKERNRTDFIIFLISGGSSSLVALPDGITLNDKKLITNLLLKSGANIHEINCIRKHLSKIKGGKILEYLVCDAISFIMSDVVGDNLSSIASGLTYYDETTFRDAKNTLKKYNLMKIIPRNVLQRINLGIYKKIEETPKHSKIKNYVIATNKNCLKAMVKKANSFGLKTKLFYPINGDVKNVAKKLVKAMPKQPKSCLIFGGETTVKVTGTGKGGRNQELVLYVLKEIQKIPQKITIASLGTDGKDGNTGACGAIMSNSESNLKDIQEFLQNNNSYSFLKKHNGLMFTGPTHTNLMDIGIMLRQ